MKKSLSIFQKEKQPVNNILYEAGFAGRMIELEIILESDNYNLSQIKTLMGFYAKAVDYYMNIQSESFIFFNNKIKSLLLKPRVNKLLSQDHTKIQKDDFKVSNIQKNMTLKKKNFHLNKHLTLNNQKEQVDKIFQTIQINTAKRFDLYEDSLRIQIENFQQKLEKRKLRSKKSTQDCSTVDNQSLNSIEQQSKNFIQEKQLTHKMRVNSFTINNKQNSKKQLQI